MAAELCWGFCEMAASLVGLGGCDGEVGTARIESGRCRATVPLPTECFHLITESNNAVQSECEREEGKQGSAFFFIGLIRRLAKTTCNRTKHKVASVAAHLPKQRLTPALQRGN